MRNERKIVALLTDFGTKDYFVGALKGVILSINEKANIIDITHEIPPQSTRSAGFVLNACYKNFPHKTIFTAVVDPGVGSHRQAILVETKNYYFIAPDNGLLSFIFDGEKDFRVYELTNDKFFHNPVSRTFHGRDIFAPVAAHLSNGVSPNEFGDETKNFQHFKIQKPQETNGKTIEAEIIHIDHFGNLITNLEKENLPKAFTLEIKGKIIGKLRKFFAEAEKSEIFMIFGSAGFLEIVSFQDSAETIINAEVGEKVFVKY